MLAQQGNVEKQFSEIVDFHRKKGKSKWSLRIRPGKPHPWFIAEDVCNILGLKNKYAALRKLDDDEKDTITVIEDGESKNLHLISEPGFYSLVFRSRKPNMREFRRWVTHDVLPTLRTTGSYGMLDKLHRELVQEILDKKIQLQALNEKTMDVTEILPSLEFKYGRNLLYGLLRHVGVLQGDNKPYPKYVERGYFVLEPEAKKSKSGAYNWNMKLKVTRKGFRYLQKLVQEWDVVYVSPPLK